MKQIYTFFILSFLSLSAVAQTRPIDVVSTWYGNWSQKSSWTLGRLPIDGDSIVVPAGKSIVLDEDYSHKNLVVNVLGNLTIKKKLSLDKTSTVKIGYGGQISAFGANRKDETIELNSVAKFDEKSIATINGAAFANTGTGVSPNGFSINSALPVTFKSFFAVKNKNTVVLNWSTAQEFNNNNFEIQKSYNGSNWTVVALEMGAGSSTSETNYSYTDKEINAPVIYYRIRQVDLDGKSEYSIVKTIRSNESTTSAKIYAYGKNVNIEFNTATNSVVNVRLVSLNGQVMLQKCFQQSSYKVSLDNINLNTGIYLVQVSDASNRNDSAMVIL